MTSFFVISSATGWLDRRRSARRDWSGCRRACPPPSLPRSTTGMPEMPCRAISASASASVSSGKMVIGSTTMPLSKRLTWRTSSACSVGRQVAVDDADAAGLRHGDRETRLGDGVHRGRNDRQIERDRRASAGCVISTAEGITREWPGRSSTSSKVNASVNVTGDMAIGANSSERRCKRQPRDGNLTACAVWGWRVLIALFRTKANDRKSRV